MKLLFPNGEHAPVELDPGPAMLGSGNDCQVVLLAPGIALHHCELQVAEYTAKLRICNPENQVTVNGKAVESEVDIKPGDLVTFAEVRCRAVAVEKGQSPVPQREASADDDGATKVRMAMPKYVLRGVSGETFGRVFPVGQTTVAGRQSECEIHIPSEGISRRHAEMRLTADGIMVEDLGSANGTYINDRRVTRELLKPGDELRFDTVRFLLIAPGQERTSTPAAAPSTPSAAAPAANKGPNKVLLWGMVGLALAAVVLVGLKFAGVF